MVLYKLTLRLWSCCCSFYSSSNCSEKIVIEVVSNVCYKLTQCCSFSFYSSSNCTCGEEKIVIEVVSNVCYKLTQCCSFSFYSSNYKKRIKIAKSISIIMSQALANYLQLPLFQELLCK